MKKTNWRASAAFAAGGVAILAGAAAMQLAPTVSFERTAAQFDAEIGLFLDWLAGRR